MVRRAWHKLLATLLVRRLKRGVHADPARAGARPRFRIRRSVYEGIRRELGSRKPEEGGPLGGPADRDLVTEFHFDATALRTSVTYTPDHDRVNALLHDHWNPRGIRLKGFVHLHPPGCRAPSLGDREYARAILAAIPDLPTLYLPIAQSDPACGYFELIPYVAVREGDRVRVEPMELVVEADGDEPQCQPVVPVPGHDETFSRVRTAYDLDRLSRCRAIYVGLGGGAGFAEDMARAGVGEHVLIDPDVVTETNLATQQAYRKDLGRPKVECVAERLRDINHAAVVLPIQRSLNDLNDDEFERLAKAPLADRAPVLTLLCGLTDNFWVQARINHLALHFGIPSLCAQVYQEGRGAEVTFTYPGVTPACHRCATNSRYRAYLDEGFRNDVTSDGTPIFATTRLNSLKGVVAMALAHHGTDHPRWGSLLSRIGNRNLVLIRMDPDIGSTLGLSVFDRVFSGADAARLLCDETIWLPQKPDNPENGFPTCPDCGGTGDLRNCIGTFADTREIRR